MSLVIITADGVTATEGVGAISNVPGRPLVPPDFEGSQHDD